MDLFVARRMLMTFAQVMSSSDEVFEIQQCWQSRRDMNERRQRTPHTEGLCLCKARTDWGSSGLTNTLGNLTPGLA